MLRTISPAVAAAAVDEDEDDEDDGNDDDDQEEEDEKSNDSTNCSVSAVGSSQLSTIMSNAVEQNGSARRARTRNEAASAGDALEQASLPRARRAVQELASR